MTAEVVAPFNPGDLVLWFDSAGHARVGEYAGLVNDVVIDSKDTNSTYHDVVEVLKSNPYQWTIIDSKPLTVPDKRRANSLVALISQGRLRAFRPSGAFQATSRVENGFIVVWARFVDDVSSRRTCASIETSNFDMSNVPLFHTSEDQSQYSVIIVKDDKQSRKIVLNDNLLPWRRDA